ncbi:MAG: zinc ribbon domain-containing protein [Planctomycetota bacterium]|nr:MAG: zinc ribbon domain-containing protein [Planctomycetota bacterium]
MDEHDDDLYEHDYDGEPYGEEEDEPTVACPYCKREIHEDAQRCPYCEQYISAEDSPPGSKPWWIVLGAVLALFGLLWWVLF